MKELQVDDKVLIKRYGLLPPDSIGTVTEVAPETVCVILDSGLTVLGVPISKTSPLITKEKNE